MNEELLEYYTNEIIFLLGLKKAIGKLNNRIHDILSFIAIEKLKNIYNFRFEYNNAGAAGIDIKGYDIDGNLKLIAEVKTTLTDINGLIRGPQKTAIKNDLNRLLNQPIDLNKYFVVLSQETKQAIETQLDVINNYPRITIINALDEVIGFNDDTEE